MWVNRNLWWNVAFAAVHHVQRAQISGTKTCQNGLLSHRFLSVFQHIFPINVYLYPNTNTPWWFISHHLCVSIFTTLENIFTNTYKYWQIFQLSNNKVTAPTSEMKVGHTSSAEAPMISYIYKRVREGVTSRTLFWVYIQNVFTFQIGWENAPKTAPGVLGP